MTKKISLATHLERSVNMNQDLIQYFVKNAPKAVETKVIHEIMNGTVESLSTAHVLLSAMIERKKETTPAVKKAAVKKVNIFNRKWVLSADLQAVVGPGPMVRTDVVKNLWSYIKKNNLQSASNRRNINTDEKLAKIMGGKKTVTMFEMCKLVTNHLK